MLSLLKFVLCFANFCFAFCLHIPFVIHDVAHYVFLNVSAYYMKDGFSFRNLLWFVYYLGPYSIIFFSLSCQKSPVDPSFLLGIAFSRVILADKCAYFFHWESIPSSHKSATWKPIVKALQYCSHAVFWYKWAVGFHYRSKAVYLMSVFRSEFKSPK